MTVQRMCDLGGISRAGFYRYDADVEAVDPDLDLRDEIQRIALEFPSYGRLRITQELKRRGRKEVGHVVWGASCGRTIFFASDGGSSG